MSIPLALLSALLFAVSSALQQHAARSTARRRTTVGVEAADQADVEPESAAPVLLSGLAAARSSAMIVHDRNRRVRGTDRGRTPLRILNLLRRLARDPLWLFGWITNVAGFGVQAAALHIGSITVVQALVVTQLLFALPLGTIPTGRRPLPRDWLGAATVCAGLITLLTVRGNVPQTTDRRSEAWLVVAVAAGLIALLVLLAWLARSHPQPRTAAVAAAAGICFCMTAVFLVFTGDDLSRRGLPATALDWPPAGLVASTVLGMLLVQDAFAGGSLPTAMTAMTITDPVASWVAGIVLFDVRPAMRPDALPGSALAIVLIALGVAILATSPTLHDERHRLPGE